MEKRVNQSGAKLWVVLNANRWLIAGLVLLVVFAALVALGVADRSPLSSSIRSEDPVDTLFQALVTSIITGVTLVVSINQLVLSQELGPLGDQRSRMSGAMEFRKDVEETIQAATAPPGPASFLSAIIDGVQTRANALADAVAESRDEELREHVSDYVDSLTENATEVGDRLEDAEFGTFDVVWNALNFNYSWKIYEARRIRNEHEDSLTEEGRDAFDEIVEVLEFFGPAREHIKTLYFQWELINLSRAMMYSAVPALIIAASMIVYFDAQTVPGAFLGVDNVIWITSFATTVALAPFTILLSYILRIATVAKRTLSIGPLILRDTDRSDDLSWDE